MTDICPFSLDEQIEEATTIGIAGHIRPDGDCVGSTIGMYNYIREYFPEKDVLIFLDPIPNKFKFLQSADQIKEADEERTFDLFIALDCGSGDRLGRAYSYFTSAKKSICIDHHKSNLSFGDLNYIVPDASSASELVYDLICHRTITKDIAEALYMGIVNDTGVFQYSCTSEKTYRIAGALVACGIDFSSIVEKTFFEKTYNQSRIQSYVILNSTMHADGRIISGIVTRDDMERFSVNYKELDGIVAELRNIKGVEVSIFIYEEESGAYKVSTRASGDLVDLSLIAVNHGGGGHAKAAGFEMTGEPALIIDQIVEEVLEQMQVNV